MAYTKERTKAMRGFHSLSGSKAITDGKGVYQNFVTQPNSEKKDPTSRRNRT